MSNSAEALKMAIDFEKKAVEKYRDAVKYAEHKETKELIEKVVLEMDQHIETIHWIVMAETGRLEKAEETAPKETGATKLAAGKCPFSGEFAKMGIDLNNFDMSKFKP